MELAIDDVKECGYADIVARNARAGKLILRALVGIITKLYIDHDLGKGQPSGHDIIKWALGVGCLPDKVFVISWNPPGRKALIATLLANGFKQIANSSDFVRL